MSDFLGNIIARQERPTGIVRPRLPSLFESGVPASPAEPVVELRVEQDAPTPIAAQPKTIAATIQAPAADRTQSPSAPPPLQPAPFAAREEPISPSRASSFFAQAAETHLDAAPPAKPPLFSAPPPPQETPSPFFASPPRETPPPFSVIETTRQIVTETREREVVTVTSEHLRDEAAPPFVEAPTSAPLPQPQQIAPFASAPARQVAIPSNESRRDDPVRQAAPETEPQIHVTIGRIEIRAAEDRDSRPRRPEKPSPVMTLEDYLKSKGAR